MSSGIPGSQATFDTVNDTCYNCLGSFSGFPLDSQMRPIGVTVRQAARYLLHKRVAVGLLSQLKFGWTKFTRVGELWAHPPMIPSHPSLAIISKRKGRPRNPFQVLVTDTCNLSCKRITRAFSRANSPGETTECCHCFRDQFQTIGVCVGQRAYGV